MPIHPCHRWLYPIDWRELSASIRFQRAGGRCERCDRPHGREVVPMHDGRRWDEDARAWRCGQSKRLRRMLPPHSTILPTRRTRVVLSTCHLDHDPTNNDTANLAALCQRCHLLHDAPEHQWSCAAFVLQEVHVRHIYRCMEKQSISIQSGVQTVINCLKSRNQLLER